MVGGKTTLTARVTLKVAQPFLGKETSSSVSSCEAMKRSYQVYVKTLVYFV